MEPLIGPPAVIGQLRRPRRRAVILALFAFSALVILASAEPFAEGLVKTGKDLGVDEFLLVQWVAPLASEAPEIVVAVIFTLRGLSTLAMGILISAKVNQWTLLVGTLPVVYSISAGEASSLPLDSRQVEEFLLTSAQSLFALMLLVGLTMSWRSGLILLVLFVTQLAIPNVQVRLYYSLVYLGLTVVLLAVDGRRRGAALSLLPRARREAAGKGEVAGSEAT